MEDDVPKQTLDLHELCRAEGMDRVAEALGVTRRCLVDLRRGHTALTVDDLFELTKQFPKFSMEKTVGRLGAKREQLGKSRKWKKRK
jgi:hypothetical protein